MSNIITFYDAVHDDSEPPEPIIDEGVLLYKTILMIIGEAKVKKSFLAMNFAIAIAKGEGFAGFTVQSSNKVLLLSAEGGYYPTRERIKKLAGKEEESVLKNISLAKYVNLSIDDDDDYRALKNMIEYTDAKVVIIDPLIRFHSQEENSSMAMNIVFRRFRELNNDLGVSLIIIHHTGKILSKGGRGSSLIRGEYDSAITLKNNGDKHKIYFDMRHVETPSPRIVSFNKDTFWFEASTDNDKVVEYLTENGSISRTALTEEWVSSDTFSNSHGYRLINEAIKKGNVREGEDGKLHLPEEK